MKTVTHLKSSEDNLLHIVTEGAVVNIWVGLVDNEEREFIRVQVLPAKGWVKDGEGFITKFA